MYTTIYTRYFNPLLCIGLQDVRNAWHIQPGVAPVRLSAIVYQEQLYYRLPLSGRRIRLKTSKYT